MRFSLLTLGITSLGFPVVTKIPTPELILKDIIFTEYCCELHIVDDFRGESITEKDEGKRRGMKIWNL